MNKVILMGRLTRDAEVRYSQGESSSAIARFTLAVDRRFRRNNEDQTADFISCVVQHGVGPGLALVQHLLLHHQAELPEMAS